MPVNINSLNAALTALEAQAAETETVSASAIVIINGFAAAVTAAVTAALEADSAANQATVDAAAAAIEGVRVRFGASEDALGAAIIANTPQA